MITWMLLLGLPGAAAFGWWVGYRYQNSNTFKREKYGFARTWQKTLHGLTLLAYEQSDQAESILKQLIKKHPDMLEVRFALAGLFRRQGFGERAIEVHQEIVNRKDLSVSQRVMANIELARDYIEFGLLARAEAILQGLVAQNEKLVPSFRLLLKIYEQTKEWRQAIVIAKRLKNEGEMVSAMIAQYYCESAQEFLIKSDQVNANRYLQYALLEDPSCVRAIIMQGQLYSVGGYTTKAIASYRKILTNYPLFLSEILSSLYSLYEGLGHQEEFVKELYRHQSQTPRLSVALTIANHIRSVCGVNQALAYITDELYNCPSLRLLRCGMLWMVQLPNGMHSQVMRMWQEVVDRLVQKDIGYECFNCGFGSKRMEWRCPSCMQWSVIIPTHDQVQSKRYVAASKSTSKKLMGEFV